MSKQKIESEIKYSIMSLSGKLGESWLDYENAMYLYQKNQKLWDESIKKFENKIFWSLNGEIGSINEKTFLNECKPKVYYNISIDGCGGLIEDREGADSGLECFFSNEEDVEEIKIERIDMSEFEYNKLPEFDGF